MKNDALRNAVSTASITLLAATWSSAASAQVPPLPTDGYAGLPNQVDLSGLAPLGLPSNDNTPRLIRDQGARASCTVFGAIAALEIEYAAAGYGALDLSEEFLTTIGSQAMVHPIFEDHQEKYGLLGHVDFRESKISFCSGGGGVGQLANLQHVHVPVEAATGYRASSAHAKFCSLSDTTPPPPGSPVSEAEWLNWAKQSWTNTQNFGALSATALTSDLYYGVESFTELVGSQLSSGITYAAILDAGHPVVIDLPWSDFRLDATSGVFRRSSTTGNGSHAVAIVGYDRTNSSDPVFLIKNSHGETDLLRFDYDDLLGAVTSAGFVNEVLEPRARPDYRYIGRWNVVLDGFKGVLDITGLPYFNTQSFEYQADRGEPYRVDRRVGIFFPEGGDPRRVNGAVVDGVLTFYMTSADPNLEFDALPEGQRFTYRLVDAGLMVGTHENADGSEWGGYAVRDHTVSPAVLPAGHLGTPFDNYYASNTRAGVAGSYYLFSETEYREVVRIGYSAGSTFETSIGQGEFQDSSSNGRRVRIYLNGSRTRYFELFRLSWKAQVLAGYEYDTRTRQRKPALLARMGYTRFTGTHSYDEEPAPEWTFSSAGGFYWFNCPSGSVARISASDGQEYIVHSGDYSSVPVRGRSRVEYQCGEDYTTQAITLQAPTSYLYVYGSASGFYSFGQHQVFPEPRHENGLRLDWCVAWGSGCGEAAADAYCAAKGMGQALQYDIDRDVGSTDPTFVPLANRTCSAWYCDALADVVCN